MIKYDFSHYICGVTKHPCCGCSLFCTNRKEMALEEIKPATKTKAEILGSVLFQEKAKDHANKRR